MICGRLPHDEYSLNEAAHVRYSCEAVGKPITGMGIRPDDKWALPLCHKHHIHGQHLNGERIWWAEQGIDPIQLCLRLRECYENGLKSRLPWPQLRDDMILVIGMGWVHGGDG